MTTYSVLLSSLPLMILLCGKDKRVTEIVIDISKNRLLCCRVLFKKVIMAMQSVCLEIATDAVYAIAS